MKSFDFVKIEIKVRSANPGVDILQATHEVSIRKEIHNILVKQNYRFLTDEDDKIHILDNQTRAIYNFNDGSMDLIYQIRYNPFYFKTNRTSYEIIYDPHNAWFNIKNPDGSYFNINETFDRISLPNTNFNSFSSCNHDWRYGKIEEETGSIYNWCSICGQKEYTLKKERYL